MDTWDLTRNEWSPRRPEILSSKDEGRAIILDLPAHEQLQEHQVHEGAWIVVVRGELRITDGSRERVKVWAGTLVHLAPNERHEVTALTDARLLLLLTPWPGPGHPGTMTLEEKARVRSRAAARAG